MLPCDNVGVAGYKVYRDVDLIRTSPVPSFEDAGLEANTTYSYVVSSYDAANNESPLTALLEVITDRVFSYSCTDLICSFTDGSSDGDGSVVAWSWDFGDGNTSIVQNPSHSYTAGGTYTVTLTATDDAGAIDSISQGVTVSESASTGMHVGGIDGGKENNKSRWRANASFTIHDANHSPVSGAIVSYSWSSRDASGSDVCTTDGTGQCPSDWTPHLRKRNKSVTFTIDSVASSLQYQSAENHDPDSDSDGTTITIVKP